MLSELTRDMGLIKNLIYQVWDLFAEDDIKEFEPYAGYGVGWLIVTEDGDIIGFCKLVIRQVKTVEIHPYCMPDHRARCRELGKSILEWCYNNHTIEKVVGYIGVCHRSLYNTAKKIGFRDEGVNRKAYWKNGEMLDQWCVGITRKEIEAIL